MISRTILLIAVTPLLFKIKISKSLKIEHNDASIPKIDHSIYAKPLPPAIIGDSHLL